MEPRHAREELEALVHLRLLPGLGDLKLRSLLREHRSARAVLDLGTRELGRAAVSARGDPRLQERARRALAEIDRAGDRVLVVDRPGYPHALLQGLYDPPPVLFARGRLGLLERPAIAVVGSRRHTEYGAGAAERIARELAESGLVVVSGLARGIDGIAHRAALDGGTIAVLGCGVDVVYPKENARLYERIAEEGLLLSEFPHGTPPLAHQFPKRNRVIAGLARGVVVIEATEDSGSLITAGQALNMGREVYAVPGPIGRDTSRGSNLLIQAGAKLVMCAADVLEELRFEPAPWIAPKPPTPEALRVRRRPAPQPALPFDPPAASAVPVAGGPAVATAEREPAPPAPEAAAAKPEPPPVRLRHRRRLEPDGLDPAAAALYRALGRAPRHVDELATACDLPASSALAALLGLELSGHARQLEGARFVRT